MNNIIATWICVDTEANGTYFPSAGGNSSNAKVQDIYWRCICCFFTTARLHNPEARLILFSNTSQLPIVDGTHLKDVLQKLNVFFYVTPFEYITPVGYYNQWRNQFYEFSILKFISGHPDFLDTDRFLLLDSDCVITKNLLPMFNDISLYGCITYVIDYDANHIINGNSRKDMQDIFSVLIEAPVPQIPFYHAGEILAATLSVVKDIIQNFYPVWNRLLALHQASLPKLNEEAHVLSYLFYKLGYSGGQANKYIKRLWTDPTTFRNITSKDIGLAIWHLPAEKRHGFKNFFHWLQKRNFELKHIATEVIDEQQQKIFMIPQIPFKRKPYLAGKYLFKRLFTTSQRK